MFHLAHSKGAAWRVWSYPKSSMLTGVQSIEITVGMARISRTESSDATWVWMNSVSAGPWPRRVRSAARVAQLASNDQVESSGRRLDRPEERCSTRMTLGAIPGASAMTRSMFRPCVLWPRACSSTKTIRCSASSGVRRRCSVVTEMSSPGPDRPFSSLGMAVRLRDRDMSQCRATSLARSPPARATKAGCRFARVGPIVSSRCTGTHCRSSGASG